MGDEQELVTSQEIGQVRIRPITFDDLVDRVLHGFEPRKLPNLFDDRGGRYIDEQIAAREHMGNTISEPGARHVREDREDEKPAKRSQSERPERVAAPLQPPRYSGRFSFLIGHGVRWLDSAHVLLRCASRRGARFSDETRAIATALSVPASKTCLALNCPGNNLIPFGEHFKAAIKAHQNLNDQSIHASAKNGTLVITGSVKTSTQRDEVTNLARQVPNVQQVVNELDVKPDKHSTPNA